MTTQASTQELPRWDLSDLFPSLSDAIEPARLQALIDDGLAFAERYQPLTEQNQLRGQELLQSLKDYIKLLDPIYKISSYVQLSFATDTQNSEVQKALQIVKETSSKISESLIFYSLALGAIDESQWQQIKQDPDLKPYLHFIKTERESAKHNLSEIEEQTLQKTSNIRGGAFRRLFTEVTSAWTFPMEIDGTVKEHTMAELSAYNYNPDRNLRQKAYGALTDVLKKEAKIPSFIMNTLLLERKISDEMRHYNRPDAARHLANELDPIIVDRMVEATESSWDIVAQYYRLKGKVLGIDDLTHYDRYAPLGEAKQEISYKEAQDIILESFNTFSPEFANIANDFFTKGWIDVPAAPGKRSGAFCAGVTPSHHPYILLNYTGKPRDVTTLAHELGHGIHDVLASSHHLLDYHPVLPLAETASTFCEQVVFEALYERLDSKQDKFALLCQKMEDSIATIFRQIAMYQFEHSIHQHRRQKGELSLDEFNQYWQKHQQAIFQDSLTLGEDHKWTWLYIPHIFQTPFYVYAYAFGELLVLALYQQFREQPDSFIPRYRQLLASGGSKSPIEILTEAGIDPSQKSFWLQGCHLLRQRLEQAEGLLSNGV